MAKLDKASVEKALAKKWRKADINKLKEITRLGDIPIAMLFSCYKFNKELVIQHVVRDMERKRANVTPLIRNFMKKCKEEGINLNEVEHDKAVKKPRARKAKKGEIEQAIAKLSPVLDLFNINKKGTMELIRSIEDGNDFSQETIIKSYKVLYTLLMAKAKGETVTKKTSISYTLEDNGKGGYTKKISLNSKNEQKMFEETQSHLPDERAFAGALVVMEVIQNLEGGNNEFLTQEEKEERYKGYLKGVEQEVIAFSEKEYTEAELAESEA